jgi:zinc protease
LLSEDQFAREIKVVMEERRQRTDDQPKALVYETFMATAYQVHPYRTPVIGWMTDLESMRVEDARDWHRRWYAPNNATLVVVGDVSAAEVFTEAEKQFGPIAARPLPLREPQLEPTQRGVKRIKVKTPADLPYLVMGWHVPSVRNVDQDWEPYALEMLAAVLAGSDAARLEHELVRTERVAIAAGASYDSVNRGPAMFIVNATPAPGTAVQELEQALRDQIRRVVEQGVSEEELRRVKAQVRAGLVFDLDSMSSEARQIGALDNAGLPFDSLELLARKLTEVTAAQVQAMASKYLVDDNLTVAALDPQPTSGRKPAPPPPVEHIR